MRHPRPAFYLAVRGLATLIWTILLVSIYFSPVSLNRCAVRAKAVSPVALTYFHRFRSRLDGPVPRQVLQPVGPAGYLDQVAVVAHPVRDRARRHVVPEHPAPTADPCTGRGTSELGGGADR